MLTEPIHVPGYLARGAVLLAICGALSSVLPDAHADPLTDPNVHCLSTTFALYCDGPIQPDGTFTRRWTTTGGSYVGLNGMGWIPGTENYQTINVNEPWPTLPLGAPQFHIDVNGNQP